MTQELQESLNTLFDANQFEEIVKLAAENEEIQKEVSFIPKLALAYFHTENYKKSTDLFGEICQKSEDAVDWFNLATSAIMNQEERKGIDALDKAIRYNRETKTNGEGMPSPFMRLYAIHALIDTERFNAAYNQLNELAEVYRSLSITDDHYLYSRGVPFFDEFFKVAQKVLPKQTVTDSKTWISYLSSGLDESGKQKLGELA